MLDLMERESGACSHVGFWTFVEGVVKRMSQSFLNKGLAIKRNWMSKIEWKQSQIVQAEHVIRVCVGKQHRVYDTDFFTNQLDT